MTADVRIVAMTIADYDEVYALWSASEGMGLTRADGREAIEAYLERNPGMSFVAREGAVLVGAVLSGHDGRRGYLHHLVVAPASRGHGTGRALARRVLDAHARAGLERTHLFVHANNDAALGFWQAAGWTRRGDIVMFTHVNDRGTW